MLDIKKKLNIKKELVVLQKDWRVASQIKTRLEEFEANRERGGERWFSELCFCLLTANSSAALGMKIQERLGEGAEEGEGSNGFLNLPLEELETVLKEEGHRFYKRRSEFIVAARRKVGSEVKVVVGSFGDERRAREWLVKNVKGLGYKEASHFLRNLGFGNVAILDRHILRAMQRFGICEEIPGRLTKALTKRKYLELERRLEGLAGEVGMSLGELDLYLWWLETGKVLK
ncbi:N-glycosylase [Thermococci archaeon]|nr:MAG: N-glycosylase [Thermococci archaeon]